MLPGITINVNYHLNMKLFIIMTDHGQSILKYPQVPKDNS